VSGKEATQNNTVSQEGVCAKMAQWKWKKGALVLASVSALGLALAGCGTSTGGNTTGTTTPTKPVEGGSIVLDETQALRDLDPALSYDTQSNEVVQQLYDRLVTYKTGTNNTELTGMDAKSWTISSDSKTYTFHLRNGMKFWNGKPVTAQSFIDEIQRVATKTVASPGEYFIEDIQGEQAFNKGQAKTISGLSAPNNLTLVIHLSQPNAAFLNVMAMPFFSAVDQSYINQVGSKSFDATKAMGSGPFELKGISSSQVVLTKNPHYWQKDQYGNQMPYLDQVTIRVNNNAQLDALNFEQGQTAWLGMQQGIPSSAFPHFETTPTLSKLLIKQTQNSIFYLGLNNKIAPFNNVNARRAIEYAIDKRNIIKLFNGRGIVANQPLPPGLAGYVKNLPSNVDYTYNPTKAKQLLKLAGVKPGTKITLYSENDPEQMKMNQSIQANLQAVGLNCVIKATSWGTFLDIEEKGQAQMFASGWMQDYPEAGDFLFLFQSNQMPDNNCAMYSNKQVDQWVNQASTSTDPATRTQLYQKITDQVMSDAPWVPLYYPVAYYAVQSWVHGWFAPAVNMDPLQYVWIDKAHSAS
jgi:oligopeptide transport system substrate-binding protein